MWRLVDHRIDAAHLPRIRAARAAARATAWSAGAGPAAREWLHIDIDATLVIDHSDNKAEAATLNLGHGWYPAIDTDADGMRVTAFITDTVPGAVPGQLAGLELRHRQHARVEDRIRELKAAGLRNLPCQSFDSNAAWLEIVLAAADLVAWTQLIGFTEHPELARCEIAAFRYRVPHVAARIARGARQLRLRIDATWQWATPIATAWQAIRTAFG